MEADSPFEVESADKGSGLITLSYNVDDASQYVDCGQSHRTFDFQDEYEEYDYPTVADVSFKEMVTWEDFSGDKPAVLEVRRDTNLEGVVEVSLKPRETMTDLEVKATYDVVIPFKEHVTKYSAMDGEIVSDIVGGSETVDWDNQETFTTGFPSFTTDESVTKTFYEGTVFEFSPTCIPKGALEAEVLEMAES